MTAGWLAAALAAFGLSVPAAAPPPVVAQVQVGAPPKEVWRAWTTEIGVRGFFAPAARIEPRVGGAYELYFLPDRPAGQRGSEGATILAMEPPHRLMFSWNAPVPFGPLREQLTVVELRIEPRPGTGSTVTLVHHGWGDGEGWHDLRDYFAGAWPIVLARLAARFGGEAAAD